MSNRQPFQLDLHQIHTRSQQPNAHVLKMATSEKPSSSKKDTSKVHKLSLKGSAKLVAEFVCVFAPLSSALPPSGRPVAPRHQHALRPTHLLTITSLASVAQFQYSIHSILYQRGVYPAEDFTVVKKYGLNMLVSSDDQVKAYIRKIMSALDRWMKDGKISKLVIVVTEKDTGEHVERWQFDVSACFPFFYPPPLTPSGPKQ